MPVIDAIKASGHYQRLRRRPRVTSETSRRHAALQKQRLLQAG
jgi:hypothetical protein